MYRYRRYQTPIAAGDADANAGSAGFGLPPSNSNSGTIGQGPLYTFKIYKYHLDYSVAFNVVAGGTVLFAPALAWVLNAGTVIDYIESDGIVLTQVTAGGASYCLGSFDHDYGSDGLTVYRPAVDANAYFLGIVNRSAPAASASHLTWSIDYGIDIDYRKLTGPVLTTP